MSWNVFWGFRDGRTAGRFGRLQKETVFIVFGRHLKMESGAIARNDEYSSAMRTGMDLALPTLHLHTARRKIKYTYIYNG